MKTLKPNLKAMIATNHRVNGVELKKGLKVLRELEKSGMVKHTYSLDRRKVMIVSQGEVGESDDPAAMSAYSR